MRNPFLTALFSIGCLTASAQQHTSLTTISTAGGKAINSIKLAEDSLCSSFVIVIKDEVKPHKHISHTENVYIIEGMGTMTLGDSSFSVKPGDHLFIPKNTPHSLKVTSPTPVKVLSVQAPRFDGTDRVFIK